MEKNQDKQQESLRLKSFAESKFSNSNIKSSLKYAKKAQNLNPSMEGISSMVTALKILKVASKENPEWYNVLQVEPFSHINSIKKQYKKLALLLHPDKNTFVGCEDAFKLVSEGFRVLSDKIRRKEYDMKLRIRLQEERVSNIGSGSSKVETFWTCCARCRLLHQFERRYLGHNLVCPNCKKTFKAVEVEEENEEDDGGGVGLESERAREKLSNLREKSGGGEGIGDLEGEKVRGTGLGKIGGDEGDGVWSGGRLRPPGLKRKIFSFDEVLERSKSKKVKFVDDEMMTLAEMQLVAKKKASKERSKFKDKEKQNVEKEKEKQNVEKEKQNVEKEKEKQNVEKEKQNVEKEKKQNVEKERNVEKHHMEKERNIEKKKKDEAITKNSKDVDREKIVASRKSRDEENEIREVVRKSKNVEIGRNSVSRKSLNLKIEERGGSKSGGSKKMAVEDSDFYDFDRDRVERSFKKAQVWAIYDDDDGMPRHYGLIDEVISLNPFEVALCWLDLQTNGDPLLIGWQKIGFHVPCGRYKVGKTTITKSLNIFSHVVECERAAREAYRIYPKKGSVWAVYSEADMDAEGGNLSTADKRHYDIVIVLSNYSEVHGLSTAYLEKVDGFKTVFKRLEIGYHAVRLLGKDDVRLFSHQIPSRKLSGNDVPDLLKDCWELDPASLPSELLIVERKKCLLC